MRYDANAAEVTVDGRPAAPADLAAGEIVHVVGTVHAGLGTGTADRVESEAVLVADLEGLAPEEGLLFALGQTVRIDGATLLDPRLGPPPGYGLVVGDRIRIHGWRNAAGEILATRLALGEEGGEEQVVGLVTDHDAAGAAFRIGGLDVGYGTAVLLDLPGGRPGNGAAVVARGIFSGGTFVAREVRRVPVQMVQRFDLLW